MQLLALAVLLPLLLGGPLCAFIGARLTPARRQGAAWAAAAVTAAVLALLLSQAPAVFAGQTLLQHTPWMPALGLDANFRLDGLALMFGLMITGVGAAMASGSQKWKGNCALLVKQPSRMSSKAGVKRASAWICAPRPSMADRS